ncbi:brassinosteroid-responsive RING protein 1-like [Rhododendron vialii]|uniref:brassinosteroid-responsive RING protein 1-like n=1 Tax=Rhododendron vialii TaxID=182163 RepID=UPI00265E6D43|nr:brassinosteroid-responsive RING protein 1-like [Rhododendron vialii]
MGYPYGSTEFRLPNLLLHTLLLPGLIGHLISSLFHPLGLSHYLLNPQTPSSPARPNSLSDLNPRSLSRFQDLLLPVMKFSDLVADHPLPLPPEDCAVCLCAFDGSDEVQRLTNCLHIFHRSCLDPWMDEELFIAPGASSHDLLSSFSTTHCGRPRICPLCRAPLVPS